MEIIEISDPTITFLTEQLSSGFDGHPSKLYGYTGGHRSGGMHLSDILQDLYIRLEKPKPGGGQKEPIWTAGLAWEHVLSWGWSQVFPDQPDRIIHMGEFTKDGVVMTPDRVDVTWPGVVEMKATWKSLWKWPIQEQWYWLAQVKAYCHALGMDQARFYVLYLMDVMGMYGGPPSPPKCWEVRFTQRELEMNWTMVINHRDFLLKGDNR